MPNTQVARHRRKRHGQHQKRNGHFLRVYTPYLPLIAFIAIGLAVGNFWRPQSHTGVLSYSTEISASALLSSTNTERSKNSASNLTLNGQLSAAAQAKANDMSARNYWSHNTPDGNPPWVFITNAGYSYSRAGENLAYGFATSADTITGWMNSPSHRDNLLNKDYSEVGFGFTNAPNYNNNGQETIVVAMYATPYAKTSTAAPAPKTPVAGTPKQTTTQTKEPINEVKHDVEVLIVDSDKKPVAGVKVTLHSNPREAVTDNDGVALFNDVEAGNHTATAEVDGEKREQAVSVANDAKVVSVTIPKPVAAQNTTTPAANKPAPTTAKISRLDVITRGALPWLASVLSVIAMVGSGYVIGKHGRALHRLVVRGEKYVLQHTLLDATIVSFVWLCYVVTQSAGFIL